MKLRFQADADLNQIIVLAAVRREPSIDFQTAGAADLVSLNDHEKTMPRHFAAFIRTETSSGLLVIPQHLSIATVVEDLTMIWSITEAEEWINRVGYLPL